MQVDIWQRLINEQTIDYLIILLNIWPTLTRHLSACLHLCKLSSEVLVTSTIDKINRRQNQLNPSFFHAGLTAADIRLVGFNGKPIQASVQSLCRSHGYLSAPVSISINGHEAINNVCHECNEALSASSVTSVTLT